MKKQSYYGKIWLILLLAFILTYISCDDQLQDNTHIHSWDVWQTFSVPTCTAIGQQIRTCVNCSEIEAKEIVTLSHLWLDNWEQAFMPTCMTPAGEIRVCNREDCKETQTRNETIAALGHLWLDNWEQTAMPTCTVTGSRERMCSRYNCIEIQIEPITAFGHAGVSAIAPTCITEGNVGSGTCTRSDCGQVVIGTVIPALGHIGLNIAIAPTCITEGNSLSHGICTRSDCGQVVIGNEIPALGHIWSTWSNSTHTVNENGIERRDCQRAGCSHFETITILAGTVRNVSEWNALVSYINASGNGREYTITVVNDFSLNGSNTYTFTPTDLIVTIQGNKTISLASSGLLLFIGSNQQIILHDIQLTGLSNNNQPLVVAGGTFIMQGSASVNNNRNNNGNSIEGGGVYSSGSFIMKDNASVYGNTDNANYNYGSQGSGGVCLNRGTLTMQDNASIYGNTSLKGGGGGVNMFINTTFIMLDNSSVHSNTVLEGGGGGVNVTNGTFTMYDNSSVYNNSASGGSGAVGGVKNNGIFTMYDSTSIYGNNASSNYFIAGGVSNSGTFRLINGIVYGGNAVGNHPITGKQLRNISNNGSALSVLKMNQTLEFSSPTTYGINHYNFTSLIPITTSHLSWVYTNNTITGEGIQP